jgi:class 3 adenylate cyclase/tetratricopeptide (TPR) repeat protein
MLHCGLTDGATLAARLEPQDVLKLIAAFRERSTAIIDGLGGEVVSYRGGTTSACFGYPEADEYDAERAIWAGLRVVEAAAKLSLGPTNVAAQVGIATGNVVVGNLPGKGLSGDSTILGEASDLAARLMLECEAGGVVISASTRRLVGGLFDYRALQPTAAFQVLGECAIENRFEALRGAGLTPFVGREEEIALLLGRWKRTKAGIGRLVLLSGEPGIGKSRLVREFRTRLDHEAPMTLSFFCSPLHSSSAYYPIIRQVEHLAGWDRADGAKQRFCKLEALLNQTGTSPEGIALIANLLSVPTGGSYPRLDLSPRQRRARTLQTLLSQVEGFARQGPVLIVFEDVHSIDPTSREVLDALSERAADLPILLIATSRPQLSQAWPSRILAETLMLNRLQDDEVAEIVMATVDQTVPAELARRIVERAEGIPLFAEELARATLGSNAVELSLPETLHDSLMARLDRVPAAKPVAQIGAVLGRNFSYELVAALADQPEPEVFRALDALVTSGLASCRGTVPHATYAFKHALIETAAYESITASQRSALHGQIVGVLLKEHPDYVDSQPDVVAYHCERAGLIEQAIENYTRAGWRSDEHGAYEEARDHFRNAARLTRTLSDGDVRDRLELRALRGLCVTARWNSGYAAPEIGQIAARELHLCARLNNPPIFVDSGYGLWSYYLVRSDLQSARDLAERLLRWGEERDAARGRTVGHTCVGWTNAVSGEFGLARSHLEHALELYDACVAEPTVVRNREPTLGRWGPSRRNLFGFLGHVACWTGRLDAALAYLSAAAAASRDEGYLPAILEGLYLSLRGYSWMVEPSELVGSVEHLISLSCEHGVPLFGAIAKILKGHGMGFQGDPKSGAVVIRQGLEAYDATGAALVGCWLRALLAETLQMVGKVDEALHILTAAVGETERTGETWYMAELCRRIGEAHRQHGDDRAAVQSFEQALSVAQSQGAKLWELRAATSYADMLHAKGMAADARACLAPVYAGFTEGFDTVPLRAARALLDQLDASKNL